MMGTHLDSKTKSKETRSSKSITIRIHTGHHGRILVGGRIASNGVQKYEATYGSVTLPG